MRIEEINEIRRKLPCERLRYFGKPMEDVSVTEMLETGFSKGNRTFKIGNITVSYEEIEIPEYPEMLKGNEQGYLDFIYLRACMYLGRKPCYFGQDDNAMICARVMGSGGGMVDMYEAGASAEYASLLSTFGLDVELQESIVCGYENRLRTAD